MTGFFCDLNLDLPHTAFKINQKRANNYFRFVVKALKLLKFRLI